MNPFEYLDELVGAMKQRNLPLPKCIGIDGAEFDKMKRILGYGDQMWSGNLIGYRGIDVIRWPMIFPPQD